MDKIQAKDPVEVHVVNGIHVMVLNTKQNRFNPDFIRAIHAALDKVEASKKQTALVTVSTQKNAFSTGLDLKWAKTNPDGPLGFPKLVKDFVKLCARLYVFPVPTIACLNGHAWAGGLMLAMSHDYRYMSKGKGEVCLPEIDIGMWLPPSMTKIVATRVTPDVYRELFYGGRFSPVEARQMRIVDDVSEPKDLFETAMIRAKQLAKKDVNRVNLQKIKYIAYKPVCDTAALSVEEDVNFSLPEFKWAAKL